MTTRIDIPAKRTFAVLNAAQINKLKEAYRLTETEIIIYVSLNYKYRNNGQALLHKLLTE